MHCAQVKDVVIQTQGVAVASSRPARRSAMISCSATVMNRCAYRVQCDSGVTLDVSCLGNCKYTSNRRLCDVCVQMLDSAVELFNFCVSQQEGQLKGIKEESWNKHQDLENHCGLFSQNLTQPYQAE